MSDRDEWLAAHPSDLAGLARAFARRGRVGEALECVEAALGAHAWRRGIEGGGPLWRGLAADRARLLARLGRRDEALAAWLDIGRRGGPGAALAWLHVARHREWVERDYAAAIDACLQALAITERARLWGRAVPTIEQDLARRLPRLRRRVAAARPLTPTASPLRAA